MHTKLKITILSDNFAGARFLAEHGLSFLIEIDNQKILFDTGASDIFLQNAKKLDINIAEIKTVVLSHGHWDHGNGLVHLKNKKLITHPNSFIKRHRKTDNEYIGLNLSFDDAYKNFNVHTSKKHFFLSKDILFLGEIEKIFDFEQWQTPYIDELGNDDFVPDDSALAIIVNKELIIVTGCSHSGICNIIEHAKNTTGITKIKTVIGGFHLKKDGERTSKTIEYLKKNNIENIMPSHCTQLPALSAFFNAFKIEQIKTGMIFNF